MGPDGKTQITIEYVQKADGSVEPKKIHTIVISTQHAEPSKQKRSTEQAGKDMRGKYTGKEMIARDLQLRQPKYNVTAAYCHFGRTPYTEDGKTFFSWEDAKDLSSYDGEGGHPLQVGRLGCRPGHCCADPTPALDHL